LGKYGHEAVATDPGLLGGFAEYCYIVPHTGILRLPAVLSDKEAVPLNCGVATMISVCEAAAVGIGDVVVVQGLGLLGLYGCAIARARGARRVIALDAVPSRLELARRFGAHHAIDLRDVAEAELAPRIRTLSEQDGADVVLEVCGNPAAVPVAIESLRVGGRCVLAGLVNPGSRFTVDGNDLIRKLVTIRGVHNYHPRHLVQAVDFVVDARDRFPFEELVDAVYRLSEINEAFAHAAERSVLRAAIVP
jgi:alcohol dehydrogenase